MSNDNQDYNQLTKSMLRMKFVQKSARNTSEILDELAEVFGRHVGSKLITMSVLERKAEMTARRIWTSHPVEYPTNGLKTMLSSEWGDCVIRDGKTFVCHDEVDVKRVMPDFQTIFTLGCGSVLNLPVSLYGNVIGTVNLLHDAHWFTPDRIARAEELLALAYTPILLSHTSNESLNTWNNRS